MREDPWDVPALYGRRGRASERFAGALSGRHPVAVFIAALLCGLALMVAIATALGLLVTDVLVKSDGIASADSSLNEWFADHRNGWRTDASAIGSFIGGAPLLPILVGLIAIVCALRRKWRIAAFAVFVLAAESATYRISSMLVPRDRPHVHRLENLEPDASYPSGHTAAAIAVYAGLVLLLTSRFTSGKTRVAAWAVAIALPIFVALARMYRGMHHPLDVAGGVVVGIAAILVLLFACRAAGAASEARGR